MKEFKLSTWAVNNRTSVYVITILIMLFGLSTYNNLPKEQFPDIVIPTMYIGTVYPGTTPTDMENLVTRPIEKQLKSINGVKRITSNSVQDFSMITVEFTTDVPVTTAKERVKDAVDKARVDLPTDLPKDPDVLEVDFSEFPIMYVNVAADMEPEKLKKYAKLLKDRIETLPEITRCDMVGSLEREVQVDVDLYKAQAAKITLSDIERAIMTENMNISGGLVKVGEMRRSLQIAGQYVDPSKIGDIKIKSMEGAPIILKDIATVTETYKDRESYARLDGKPVITLNVIKRSGENLVEASDKIREITNSTIKNDFPENVKLTITGDQSSTTRNTLSDLVNSIILGFILVTLILMFFLGTTNALFVGLSVPIASFMAFIFLPTIGFTLNMIVLFSFLLALGIVVDDAIVVVENTHRIFHLGGRSIKDSVKFAAGEVFIPVLAGTATTLCPFIPLAFWPGLIGKFMFYLPVTLIIVLSASLVVAFFMNTVFAVSFMKKDHEIDTKKSTKKMWQYVGGMAILAVLFYLGGIVTVGNLIVALALVILINRYAFTPMIQSFQQKTLPAIMKGYRSLLTYFIHGRRPIYAMFGMFGLFIFSIVLFSVRTPKVIFFPQGDPNFIYVYLELPIGTDIEETNKITEELEKRVKKVVGENNPYVESIISNVAIGAGDPREPDRSSTPHKGKVTVAFVEFNKRNAESTAPLLNKIRNEMKGIPGAIVTVDKEQDGPPVGKPINIEISGENLEQLIALSENVKAHLDSLQIPGVEEIRSDFLARKPEVKFEIDRERANAEGISTAAIGMEIRGAVFGKEASKFKKDEDEYPIQVRYAKQYRESIDALYNADISFMDMSSGMRKQIPISSVSKISYGNSYGGIKRKDLKRVITLSSNVVDGYNTNEVVQQIQQNLDGLPVPEECEIKMTGEQEEQAETASFLNGALLSAFGLIFLILVTQFNSISKPFIILTEILFSVIGVLLGYSISGMEISIIMSGVGIVSLAGIVVKNGILLVEFTDELRKRGLKTRSAIIEAGVTRLGPVLLTAIATMLGLFPLAIGMNFNFITLFSEFNPHFFLGGESVVFWGPLAWTIIFGLGFATLITLVIVPVMYYMNHVFKVWLRRKRILSNKTAL